MAPFKPTRTTNTSILQAGQNTQKYSRRQTNCSGKSGRTERISSSVHSGSLQPIAQNTGPLSRTTTVSREYTLIPQWLLIGRTSL